MAHHLYVTPGFILDSKNSGEANKLLYIFTRDLGLVLASAQGVRHLKSKLRFHTQTLSFGEFSLVRGKEIWRLTGAKENQALEGDGTPTKDKRFTILRAQLFALLKRLLNGEEANPSLFIILSGGLTFILKLEKEESVDDEELKAFEHLMVLRILASLGYINNKSSVGTFVETDEWNRILLKKAIPMRKSLIEEINRALKASHL